ncbi:hypothetical protein GEMRC1_008174 [Eukaryota sp. GEM-RC1]
MYSVSIDLGSHGIVLAVRNNLDNQDTCLQTSTNAMSIPNTVVSVLGTVIAGQQAESKIKKCAGNCFVSVTHLVLPISSDSHQLPFTSFLMNNIQRNNASLFFSVDNEAHFLTQEQLICPLLEHIICELKYCLRSLFQISSLVLPQSLLLQPRNVLPDTFHKLGYPDITVVTTLDALVASYLFKAPEPSQLETVVIVDVGHLLTKAVVFLHQPSGINIIHSEEWWMGADQVDQALYEYCLTKIDEKIRVTMNEKSKMKLLLACNKAKTKTRMSVLVEDFYPNGDFEEDVPPSVLDSFLKDLSGKLEAFRENFVKLLEEKAHYVQSQFVTKVVPVGRLAGLHSVREVMETVFNASLTFILDPNTDVALGGLRVRDNPKIVYPSQLFKAVGVQPYGAALHDEYIKTRQHLISGNIVSEDRTLSNPPSSETGDNDSHCNQNPFTKTNPTIPTDDSPLVENNRILHEISEQDEVQDSRETKSHQHVETTQEDDALYAEKESVVPVENTKNLIYEVAVTPLNHFVDMSNLSIECTLTHHNRQYHQKLSVPRFSAPECFYFGLSQEPGNFPTFSVNDTLRVKFQGKSIPKAKPFDFSLEVVNSGTVITVKKPATEVVHLFGTFKNVSSV